MIRILTSAACLVATAACGSATLVTTATEPAPAQSALGRAGTVQPDGWLFENAAFSPDGRQVVMLGTDAEGVMAIASAANGHPRAITPPNVSVEGFGWLPNSTDLVVAERQGGLDAASTLNIGIWSLDGQRLRTVASALHYDNSDSGSIAVTPDGRLAVLAVQTPGQRDTPKKLLEVDLNEGRLNVLKSSEDGTNYTHPCFVTDDILVVEAGELFTNPNATLEAIDIESRTTQRLTGGNLIALEPTCSVRSNRVVFRVQSAGDTAGLWSVRVGAASEAHQLNTDRSSVRPALYPGGGWVLTLSLNPQAGEFRMESIPA